MSTCHYCDTEVIWVPTIEGFRPFVTEVPIPAETPVCVLRRHECEERMAVLKAAQTAYAQNLASDPEIRAKALTVSCETCRAKPSQPCFDQRRGFEGKNTKNPHHPRLIEGARLIMQQAS